MDDHRLQQHVVGKALHNVGANHDAALAQHLGISLRQRRRRDIVLRPTNIAIREDMGQKQTLTKADVGD